MIFHNPVRVEWGAPDFAWLPVAVGTRRAVFVTTPGMVERGTIERIREVLGVEKLALTSSVKSNPTIASIREHAAEVLEGQHPEVIVALGGGSTLDTAKGIAAIASGGFAGDWFSSHLREGAPFPDSFAPPAIIAIPTTAGTGSEVTMWGTVWDEETGAKYSISHPRLYAERAVLVPELTLTVPPDITLFTALDVLSHCMESIWNKRSTAVSEAFASAGIARLTGGLDDVLQHPDEVDFRRRLQEAALLGGLAISLTATALAHSISYPLTSKLGMPHGLACGFTLPEMLRFNADFAPEPIHVITSALRAGNHNEAQAALARKFSEWGVPGHVQKYLDETKARAMRDELLTPGRAENNVRAATHEDALGIVLRSL